MYTEGKFDVDVIQDTIQLNANSLRVVDYLKRADTVPGEPEEVLPSLLPHLRLGSLFRFAFLGFAYSPPSDHAQFTNLAAAVLSPLLYPPDPPTYISESDSIRLGNKQRIRGNVC